MWIILISSKWKHCSTDVSSSVLHWIASAIGLEKTSCISMDKIPLQLPSKYKGYVHFCPVDLREFATWNTWLMKFSPACWYQSMWTGRSLVLGFKLSKTTPSKPQGLVQARHLRKPVHWTTSPCGWFAPSSLENCFISSFVSLFNHGIFTFKLYNLLHITFSNV